MAVQASITLEGVADGGRPRGAAAAESDREMRGSADAARTGIGGRLIVRALSGSMRDKKLSESRCKPSRMDRTASGLVNGLGRGPALPRMRQAPCGATRGRPVSRAKRALA